jgi:dolichol-phosphate mannosyltransferase
MRCVVVVPTYNEAANITGILDGLVAVTNTSPTMAATHHRSDGRVDAGHWKALEVLVVDDSSPDGTADMVRSHRLFGDRIHLLTRTTKDGLGAAYRAGFSRALTDGYDVVVQMDADGSHPMDQVPAMLQALRTHDLVVGSRYAAGGRTRNWPWRRRALSRMANVYARQVLALGTKDSTSGFRAWRAGALVATGALETTSSGYGFQVENTWRAERAGLRIAEHPIVFTDRTAGTSKMTTDVALEAARLLLTWRLDELRRGWGRRSPAQAGPTSRQPLSVRR